MWRGGELIGPIDARPRYRPPVLGPFWACLSMGIQALVTGFVMSVLFKQPTANILPYVCLSLIVWNLVQNVVNEGAQTFINAGEFMLQVNRPYGVYIFRTVWGNLLVSSHMILVYFVVAFLYGLYPGWTYVLALPGLALLVLNLVWMAFAAAILSARFRDIPMIIQNLFTVLFWLTPVVYRADQLGGTVERVARLNPLFHILE